MLMLVCQGYTFGSDRLSILGFGRSGESVDRTGVRDASDALAGAITAANTFTSKGEPACVYVPPGVYRIITPPPSFVRAGCIVGDGPSQSVLSIDPQFRGDLFSWSEAWVVTTPGPMVVGLKIIGKRSATNVQNALVFYDRNDQIFIDDVDVIDLHGRALYSGVTKNTPQAYMRESHIRSLRFFGDGAPGVPVIEFSSQGDETSDATNEIRMSQIDIYGAFGPSFVIRNSGKGHVRNITIDNLRIEGSENGATQGDLLTIGDPVSRGNVNTISLSELELIDPSKGFVALMLTAPQGAEAPYHISAEGWIGGGIPLGEGIRINAGRDSYFHFSGIYTTGTNVVIGRGISDITLDGNGAESRWTYSIDASSANAIRIPMYRSGNPRDLGQGR